MAFFNKTFFKFFGGAVALAIAGFVFLYAPSFWQRYKVDRAIFELERPYREDTYGGKTPEETFDLFLGAMRARDLNLASRYFVVRKQDEYLEKFQKMRDEEKLDAQIQEWERARKEWVKVVDEYNDWKTRATVRYPYSKKESELVKIPIGGGEFDEVTIPAGSYNAEIIFDLNELSAIWKITLL